MVTALRIGVNDFVGSYPLFYPLFVKKITSNFQFVKGTLHEISLMLQIGEIDIGQISAVNYLSSRASCILLSNFGIAAKEKVMSVRLFARHKCDLKTATHFLVPRMSETATRLLTILSKCYWKSNAIIQETDKTPDELSQQELPFLLFGDTCLMWLSSSLHSIDVASEWYKATNMGFVFSLIATRNVVFKEKREEVLAFHRALMRSYRWSQENKNELINACCKKISVRKEIIDEYFRTLDYELVPEHIHGLDHFASFLL